MVIPKYLNHLRLLRKKNIKIFVESLSTIKPLRKLFNPSRIFQNVLFKATLPITSFHFDIATLVYILLNPIGVNAFSFNKFVNPIQDKRGPKRPPLLVFAL